MTNKTDLESSWERSRAHLAAGAALISKPTGTLALVAFEEYFSHNELELALCELEVAADDRRQPPAFWEHLRDAAFEMKLRDRAEQLKYRAAGAKWGYFEATLSLLSRANGGRRLPVMTGFRCPWDIGAKFRGEMMLCDAAVVVISGSSLAPGETGQVRLHPLSSELWGICFVGQVVRPWESHYFGEAVISAVVPRWNDTNP